MGLFILRFWPALLPLIAYIIWLMVVRSRARKAGQKPPHFREGPWFWAVMASLFIGMMMFIILGLSNDAVKGTYVPPYSKDGKLVPGHIEP